MQPQPPQYTSNLPNFKDDMNIQPLAPNQAPPMMNVNAPLIQRQQQTNVDNLGGNVQVQYGRVNNNQQQNTAPNSSDNGVHVFDSGINLTAWILHCMGCGFVIGAPLLIIVPFAGLIIFPVFCGVGWILMLTSFLLFKKSKIVMTVEKQGAVIPIGKSRSAAGYDEINDFVCQVLPGVSINGQPAAKVVAALKSGDNITVYGTTMYYASMNQCTQLKNFLGARMRT